MKRKGDIEHLVKEACPRDQGPRSFNFRDLLSGWGIQRAMQDSFPTLEPASSALKGCDLKL